MRETSPLSPFFTERRGVVPVPRLALLPSSRGGLRVHAPDDLEAPPLLGASSARFFLPLASARLQTDDFAALSSEGLSRAFVRVDSVSVTAYHLAYLPHDSHLIHAPLTFSELSARSFPADQERAGRPIL